MKIDKAVMGNSSFQPVFIIGAARSGTKLLRDVIAVHPLIDRVPYDINFIWRLGNDSIPHDEFTPENLNDRVINRIQRKIAGFYQGNKFLIEKTVSNCLRVPFVDAIFPDAKYIFLIRDGCDVVESVYRQWLAPPDWNYLKEKARTFPFMDAPSYAFKYLVNIMKHHSRGRKTWGPRYQGIDEDAATKDIIEVCAIQWSRCVEKACSSLEKVESSKKIVIRYEDFAQEPQQHLVAIADFLGLDSTPYHDRGLLSHVSSGNVGKGWHKLTPVQREMIGPYIDQTMIKVGYSQAVNLSKGALAQDVLPLTFGAKEVSGH